MNTKITPADEVKKKLKSLAAGTGPGRFFNVMHQPNKRGNPVRIELREALSGVHEVRVSLSRLIGYADTTADPDTLYDAALKLVATAARVDDLVGIYA